MVSNYHFLSTYCVFATVTCVYICYYIVSLIYQIGGYYPQVLVRIN